MNGKGTELEPLSRSDKLNIAAPERLAERVWCSKS